MKWLIGIGAGLITTALGFAAWASFGGTQRGPVSVRNRTLYGPGGLTYRLTDTDVLWLARAVWGEAGTRDTRNMAGVMWAMAQYHMTVIGRRSNQRPAFSSFTALLRAYCQPINPKWATLSSSGCRARPSHCGAAQIRRRAQITNASWEAIPLSVRDKVMSFIAGGVDNPVPGMVDWAAGASWQARSKVPLINIGGNMFGIGLTRRIFTEN